MQKHALTNLGYVVWREICVCISPHCNSTAIISTGRKPGIWVRSEQQCSRFGPSRNKDPCEYSSHRVPRVPCTEIHTLGLTSKAPSGNASLLNGLSAEEQMEAYFLQAGTESLRWDFLCLCRVAQPKTIFLAYSSSTGVSGVELIICPSISFCPSHTLQSCLRRKLKQTTFKSNFVFLR